MDEEEENVLARFAEMVRRDLRSQLWNRSFINAPDYIEASAREIARCYPHMFAELKAFCRDQGIFKI